MKLLITGASGFLGEYVVAEALGRGHRVRAVVRPGAALDELPALLDERIELARVDLRSKRGLVDAVTGVDAVLHLAASKAGDMYAQYAGTVVATENLLEAMTAAARQPGAPRPRIVGISSFSVYDYIRMWSYSRLTESSPLAAEFPPRDEYSHTKLVQERLIRETAQREGWDWAVLRPGVIYGRGNLWTARLGMSGGEKRWIRIGSFSRLPLSYVENCAEAIVMAAEKPGPLALTCNVIDDECPTQGRYAREVVRRLSPRPRMITIPWPAMRLVARAASMVNTLAFRGRAKLPAILVPAKLHARFKPLRYTHALLRGSLGWTPRYGLSEALDRSVRPSESDSPAAGRTPRPAAAAKNAR
jgi:nucleoside-diphosphate-sugar epimerase